MLEPRTHMVRGALTAVDLSPVRGAAHGREDILKLLTSEFPELGTIDMDGRGPLKFTQEDIAKPTEEKVWRIYEAVARRIWGGSVPAECALRLGLTVADPELFQHLQVKAAASCLLAAVIRDSCGHRFTILDIVAPRPAETRLFISVLIKFLKVYQSVNKHIKTLSNDLEERWARLKSRDELMTKKDEELKIATRDAEERERQSSTLKEVLSSRRSELRQVFDLCEETKKKIEEQRSAVEKLKLKKSSAEVEYQELCEECDRLVLRIITSEGDRLREKLRTVETEIDAHREAVNAKRAELGSCVQKLHKRTKNYEKVEELMVELAKVADLKTEVTTKKEERDRTLHQVKSMERMLNCCREEERREYLEDEMLRFEEERERDNYTLALNRMQKILSNSKRNAREERRCKEAMEKNIDDLKNETYSIESILSVRSSQAEADAESTALRLHTVREDTENAYKLYRKQRLGFVRYAQSVQGALSDDLISWTTDPTVSL